MGNYATASIIEKIALDAMVRSWQVVRICLGDSLAFGSLSPLHLDWLARRRGGDLPAQGLRDAEAVQRVVVCMSQDPRAVFESHYLGTIEAGARNRRRKRRWEILEISERAYFYRLKEARRFLADNVDGLQ